MDMKNEALPSCEIQTFIFFDLETTGLIRGHKIPKITEMSLIAVSRNAILTMKQDRPPRVMHKLVIPLCPKRYIPLEVSNLTGLYNDVLESEKPLDKNVYVMLTAFLNKLSPPVCFIAHNGNEFDYPILIEELRCIGKDLPNSILSIDSKIGFKALFSSIDENDRPNEVELIDETVSKAHPPYTTASDHEYETVCNQIERDYYKSLLDDDFEEALALTVDLVDSMNTTPKQDCEVSAFQEAFECNLLEAFQYPSTSKEVAIDESKRNNGITDLERSPKRSELGANMQEINEKTPSQRLVPAGTMNPHKAVKKKKTAIRRKRLPFTLNKPPNFKLATIYEHLFGRPPEEAHSAEADCLSMLRCVIHVGNRFIRWADLHAVPLMKFSRVAN